MHRGTAPAVNRDWVVGAADDTGRTAVRLFCFPPAGGGAAFYRPWIRPLRDIAEVRPVLFPGRETRLREAPFYRMEDLIDPLCHALEPLLDRPYALYGHSMGAIVAYEVARRLGARPPVLLLVSGRRAPALPARRRRLSGLPDDEFLTTVATLGGIPPEVMAQRDLLEMILPALRADFTLNEIYRPLPGAPVACPIAACVGDRDPEVDVPEMLQWRDESPHDFTLRVVSGGHFYLKDAASPVLDFIRSDLSTALALTKTR